MGLYLSPATALCSATSQMQQGEQLGTAALAADGMPLNLTIMFAGYAGYLQCAALPCGSNLGAHSLPGRPFVCRSQIRIQGAQSSAGILQPDAPACNSYVDVVDTVSILADRGSTPPAPSWITVSAPAGPDPLPAQGCTGSAWGCLRHRRHHAASAAHRHRSRYAGDQPPDPDGRDPDADAGGSCPCN